MSAPSVLFLGGTGIISSACTRRALEEGFEVSVLGRSAGEVRRVPDGCELITADLDDPESFRSAVAGRDFDVVADFRAFGPDDVTARLDVLGGHLGQYVFISSASAYQTPPARLPITEATPLRNPYWAYSRGKIAAEDLLVRAHRDQGLPVTIVRPSHTYDHTAPPFEGGWTVVDRMRRGAEVVVHGDGTSLWTLTHHTDFARAFVGLLALPAAIGASVHITSDEWLSWNQVYEAVAAAAGVEPRLVHVTSDAVAAVDADWGAALLGDKAHSMVFDNSLVKALVPGWRATVPFARGAGEIVDWFDADPSRRSVDTRMDALMDELVARHR
ncbi:MAG: NAD-dependent dehydratase [Humibacillus sp.]|nr:NAD-dependent dehydratase [Humibacillus sp.]